MFSIDVVASAPDDPSLQNVSHIRNYSMQLPPAEPIVASKFPHSAAQFVEIVFTDSRIALLCHALCICVAHTPTESFSLLVH